jgi:hypothetical protein
MRLGKEAEMFMAQTLVGCLGRAEHLAGGYHRHGHECSPSLQCYVPFYLCFVFHARRAQKRHFTFSRVPFFRAARGKTAHKMIDTYHAAAAGEKRIFGYPLGDAE